MNVYIKLLACLIGVSLIVFTLTACRKCSKGNFYSYWPSWTSATGHDWKFRSKIHVNYCPKWYQDPGLKAHVTISVYDRSGASYLDGDVYELKAFSVKSKVLWNIFEEIRIILTEEGLEYVKNNIDNDALLKSGPRLIAKLIYKYDAMNKIFMLTKIVEGGNISLKKIN